MMNKALVVTPQPMPYESPLGFVLRTAEANGYRSAVDVMRLAGMSENKARSIRLSIERLAPLYACPTERLRGIDYRDTAGGSKRYLAVHGDRINIRYMDAKRQKLCPQCVVERGRIAAVWDLRHAVVCPVHRCRLMTDCPRCQKPLSIARPGLLLCKCGHEFGDDDVPGNPLPEAVMGLADLLDRLFHRQEPDLARLQAVGFPAEALARLSLETLLKLIDRIGKQAPSGRGQEESDRAMQELVTTAGVFEQWPAGFYRYLNRIEADQKAFLYRSLGMSRRFEGFYCRVFKGTIARDEIQFIKEAFMEYERAYLLRSDETRGGNGDLRAVVGVAEAARLMQVQPRTVRSLIDKGVVRSYRVGNDANECWMVDASGPLPQRTPGGRSLSPREAARQLGLPVSILSMLRKEGIFSIGYIGSKSGSYHSQDVDRFQARIESVLRQATNEAASDPHESSTIQLAELIRKPSIDRACKAAVIRAVLNGQLTVHGMDGKGIQAILLDRPLVDAVIVEVENKRSIGLKTKEAATMLGCDEIVIPWLLENGLIEGSVKGRFRRISRSSVEQFNQEYIFCVRIARELGKSSKKVVECCQQYDIPLHWADRKYSRARQPFIRLVDIPRLRGAFGAPLLGMNAGG